MTPHPSPVTHPNGYALAIVAAILILTIGILILVAWTVLTVAYAVRRAWTRRRGKGGSR